MPPLHTRKSLEAMKRVDLQRLCKGYGVKANLKTEDLIDLLLSSHLPAPHKTATQPTRRSISVRRTSQTESKHAGPSRVSSMIVHDLDEDEGLNDEPEATEEVSVEKPPSPSLIPTRTRKAKELQTRLGKGKPVIAGGSGPRAVTASSGSSKGRQTKTSRTLKPREPTIEEEPETLSVPKAARQGSQEVTRPSSGQPPRSDGKNNASPDPAIQGDEPMRELLTQISTIKSDIASLKGHMSDIAKTQQDILSNLHSLRELTSIVASLKIEIRRLREGSHSGSRPSTPRPKGGHAKTNTIGFGFPSVSKSSTLPISQSTPPLPHPGASESTLGKRHRDLTPSVTDEGEEDGASDVELSKTGRRDKKRAKMQGTDDVTQVATLSQPFDDEVEPSGAKNSSVFEVYRGSEGPEPPPPTDHLPEIFVADSPSDSTSNPRGSRTSSAVPTSSANASENQPFTFPFAPISQRPQNSMYMSTFPYPEPPQSPSPAGPSLPTFSARRHDERTDIFKEFGFPSPVRSIRNIASSNDERGVNPAALQGGPTRRNISSNEVAAGLGLIAHRTSSTSDPSAEGSTGRRTMFGTELDGDSRFGDFGVEGVASGFWISK